MSERSDGDYSVSLAMGVNEKLMSKISAEGELDDRR